MSQLRMPVSVAQLDARPTDDQKLPGRQHSFRGDHEIFSTFILLPSADSRMAIVSFLRKNCTIPVNRLED